MHESTRAVRVEADTALASQRGKPAQIIDRDAVHVDVHGVEIPVSVLHVQPEHFS